ncbi:unnamed protein product [Victoria cruziana]
MKASTLAVFVLVLLCLSYSLQESMAAPGMCGWKCGMRCAKAAVKDRCLKYCGICCAECKCVPSGTYGHKDECPCYRDKKSKKGTPKCP